MSDDRYEVSVPRGKQEQETLARILTRALFFPSLEQYNWLEVEGAENLRVIRVDGEVLGGLSVQRMGQWFAGSRLAMGAVRCVGILPEARSRGLATYLLRKAMEELRADAIPLAALYPATQPVYRRVGFGQAGSRIQYVMPLHAIDVRSRECTLSPIEPTDPVLEELYLEHCRRTSGHLDRNPWAWSRLRRPGAANSPLSATLISHQGRPEGYLLYTHKPPIPGERYMGQILIRDWVSLSVEATDALWTFLADQRSINEAVEWFGGPQESLVGRIANQDHEIKSHLLWMLRLVDVQKALEQRRYPEWLNAELHLEVFDEILPWNHGRFLCQFANGKATVSPGGEARLCLHVRTLASLFSGFLSPREALTSRAIEGDDTSLSLATAIFAGPFPWMADMF